VYHAVLVFVAQRAKSCLQFAARLGSVLGFVRVVVFVFMGAIVLIKGSGLHFVF